MTFYRINVHYIHVGLLDIYSNFLDFFYQTKICLISAAVSFVLLEDLYTSK